ncbi:MAG: hypothetical protein EBU01_15905 [Crocinitomicaceae bacterium]|nr:hypothetical protein [Crocinitomicaceae bacterium]
MTIGMMIYASIQSLYIFCHICNFVKNIEFIIFPFFSFFGYSFAILNNVRTIESVQRKNIHSYVITDDKLPIGTFYGFHKYYFFGYLKKDILYLISTNEDYDYLTQEKKYFIETPQNKKVSNEFNILFVNSTTSHSWTTYRKRNINTTGIVAKPFQQKIIEEIDAVYKKNKVCISFICGYFGIGKSYLGILLNKHLNGNLCQTFNPTICGDNFEYLYNLVKPNENSPLIVVLDEFDVMLENIHLQKIKLHKNYPTQIYNKCTYNLFMDNFRLNMYPYTIVLLISNKSKDYLDKTYDPSYLREKRIDTIHHVFKNQSII